MTEKRTSAAPRIVDGVAFHCYRTGIQRYEWRSEDGRCKAWSPTYVETHRASVDGVQLGTKFRTLENAMKAAVKAARGPLTSTLRTEK